MRKYIFLVLLALIIGSCKNSTKKDSCRKNEFLIQSVLWYQHSGEMQALYYQAYNIAAYRLDEYLKKSTSKKKKAVIVDIDETLLNNSPFEAQMILSDSADWEFLWDKWIGTASADTLPGALGFLKYAKNKGVEVFYVTNRDTSEKAFTLMNLQKFKFPFADEKHLIARITNDPSKEKRRKQVAKEYDIVLLCGDNLGDFAGMFDNYNESISDSIIKHKNEFGKRFIVLPNPMYGAWENQIYGKKSFTDPSRDSLRKARLLGY